MGKEVENSLVKRKVGTVPTSIMALGWYNQPQRLKGWHTVPTNVEAKEEFCFSRF